MLSNDELGGASNRVATGSGREKRGRSGEIIRVSWKGVRVWFAWGSMQKHPKAFSATI
jgi:hypothetical protein